MMTAPRSWVLIQINMTPPDADFILIVDDNPANLSILAHSLKRAGYAVRVAVDGESALQQVTEELPTLILLDVMMPGLNGFETCRQLQKNPLTSEIPVIFMTALADNENKVRGLLTGAVDYITKPFNEDEVLLRVKTHLRLRNLLHTLHQQNQQLQQEIHKRQLAEANLQQLNHELEQRVAQRTAELQRTQIKLVQQEKLSTLGELVAGVAHEINNPISCIAGNIEFIGDYSMHLLEHIALYQQHLPEPDDTIAHHAQTIDLEYLKQDLPNLMRSMQMSSDRIYAISNSLRAFVRNDTRRKSLFDLHEGIDSTLLILRHRLRAQENRSEIEVVKTYGALPEISCFPGQLNQVFMNILANAIDAFDEQCAKKGASHHGVKALAYDCQIDDTSLQIQVTTEPDDQSVSVTIQDNAGGMSDEVRSHIFEQGYTTKTVHKGTGLGLSIVHQIIVGTHGGQLHCQTQLGKGTTFTIRLPIH